jgi:hypothetical protein
LFNKIKKFVQVILLDLLDFPLNKMRNKYKIYSASAIAKMELSALADRQCNRTDQLEITRFCHKNVFAFYKSKTKICDPRYRKKFPLVLW